MTRDEQIMQAALAVDGDIYSIQNGYFTEGAKWADEHQWRAVADGAPSPGSSWVLGAFENGDIRIVRYSYACYMWLYMDNEEAPEPVYWMPIPELPESKRS